MKFHGNDDSARLLDSARVAVILLGLLFLAALGVFFLYAYRSLQISSDDRLVVLSLVDYCDAAVLMSQDNSQPAPVPGLTKNLQDKFQQVINLRTLKGMEALGRLPPELMKGLTEEYSLLEDPADGLGSNRLTAILKDLQRLKAEMNSFTDQQSHVLKVLENSLLGCLVLLAVFLLFDILQDKKRVQYRQQIRDLHRQSLADLEEERKNLSRELHDTIAQDLAAASILLSATSLAPQEKAPILDSIKRAQSQIRALAQGLRPPVIDTLGLGEALRQLAQDFSRRSGLKIECYLPEMGAALIQGKRAIYLYRIVQEAWMNSWKHAQAKRITLRGALRDGILLLEISDDGKGLSPEAPEGQAKSLSLGLVGMKERAEVLEAILTLDSPPQGGTHINLEVPL